MVEEKKEKGCTTWKFSDKEVTGPAEEIPCYEDDAPVRKTGSVGRKSATRR